MQQEFRFFLPTRIEYGPGIRNRLASLLAEITPGRRVFLVTDSGLTKAGIVQPIVDIITKDGWQISVFDQVKPNPRDVDCEAGAAAIRACEADIIVALGGGSVMDEAKAIAALASHEGPPANWYGRGKLEHDCLPLVAIPTTSGTGSEVTRSSVITDTVLRVKKTINDLRLVPRLALLDPELTYGLPPLIAASTGMDAFVHAIEAFTCRVATPFTDACAAEAMKMIFGNLRDAVLTDSRPARDALMVGSTLAGVAFSNSDVAAVHCLAEALGGLYDTPHGIANSIFLPWVTEFNIPSDPQKHAAAARICGLDTAGASDEEAAALLVAELRRLSQEIGIPRFRDLAYVRESDFPRLSRASFENGSTPDNCRDISESDYLSILQRAYA